MPDGRSNLCGASRQPTNRAFGTPSMTRLEKTDNFLKLNASMHIINLSIINLSLSKADNFLKLNASMHIINLSLSLTRKAKESAGSLSL